MSHQNTIINQLDPQDQLQYSGKQDSPQSDLKADSAETALGELFSLKTICTMQDLEPKLRYGSQDEIEKKEGGEGQDSEAPTMTILPPEKVEIKRNLKAKDKRENIYAKVANQARRAVDILEQPQGPTPETQIDDEEEKVECKYSSSFSDEEINDAVNQLADVDLDSKENIQNNPDDYTESEDEDKEQQQQQQQQMSSEEYSDGCLLSKLNETIGNVGDLSSKKLQYLDQDIADRRGTFKYTDDPNNYKKARKRLQNRESAVRSRQRKANEIEYLREEVQKLKTDKATWQTQIDALKQSNQQWKDLFTQMQIMNQMNNQQLIQNQQSVLNMFRTKQ